MSVMTTQMYKDSMEKRLKDDKIIERKEINQIQRKLNEHSKDIVRIFKVGEDHGQHLRSVRNATVHVDGELPIMKGAEKDHKKYNGTIKMRPMLNAMDGPKKNISDIFNDNRII